jgi:PAS domain S-box-containing protein
MSTIIAWIEQQVAAIPLPVLETWGRLAYLVGLGLAVCAFGRFTFRIGSTWGLGRERQTWNERAFLAIPLTFVLIVVSGYLGSFIVLVPEAQTFESLKDLVVILCLVLFGYPALITIPFAYGLSDLIEGIPPAFLLGWLPGYFINPACFWVAYQLIGRQPDFRRAQTWPRYVLAAAIFMSVEPVLWGFICSDQFTPAVSYQAVTSALFFTTAISWLLAPAAMLGALPLARRLNLFWAEIPGHVRERLLGSRAWLWEAGCDGPLRPGSVGPQGLPIRMFLLAPFIALVLVMVGVTAYVTLRSAEVDATKLAARLNQETAATTRERLDDYLTGNPARTGTDLSAGVSALMRGLAIAKAGRAFIVDRSGALIASSAAADDAVVTAAIDALQRAAGGVGAFALDWQFQVDHVTPKPLSRQTWLMYASVYPLERIGRSDDWILVTAMPETSYLAGVQSGSSRSAMVFAVALLASLGLAATMAATVTAPLRRISHAIGAFERGDLTERVPGSRLEELNFLSLSFNDMATRLQASFASLRGEVQVREKRERELRDSEARVRASERLLEAIATGLPLPQVLEMICRFLEDRSSGRIASILVADAQQRRLHQGAAPSLPKSYIEAMEGLPIGEGSAVCGTAAFRRAPVVVSDLAHDPLVAEFRELAAGLQLGSCWSTPILSSDQKVLGTFAVYTREPCSPTSLDRELIQHATHLASIAIERRQAEGVLEDHSRLLDLSHDTIFVWRADDGIITFWNRSAEELYGWARHEAVGRTTRELLQTVFPQPLSAIRRHLDETGRWEGELVHTTRAGSQVVVASRWSLQADIEGRPARVLETNNDITARRRVEDMARKARDELAHAGRLATMGELAASIAHEVNQPLAGVVTNASACLRWLAREVPNLDEARQAVQRIARDGKRASDVVARVRAMARKTTTEREPLDINEIVRGVVMVVEGELRKQHVALAVDYAGDLPVITGDRVQLQQVVLNLMMNGIEAMNGVTDRARELAIGTAREGEQVLVSIRDRGTGLAPETMTRMFDAFYTTKSDGLGMGLSISRSIVEDHGGRLWATAGEGPGTTFHFTI